MREELEVFENRHDDWLAKERKYEDSVSAWDFDEGKKLRKAHEEHCDSLQLKEGHRQRHNLYNQTHQKGVIASNGQYVPFDAKRFVLIFVPIMVAIFVISMIITFASFGAIELDELLNAVPIIVFIIIALTVKGKKEKK